MWQKFSIEQFKQTSTTFLFHILFSPYILRYVFFFSFLISLLCPIIIISLTWLNNRYRRKEREKTEILMNAKFSTPTISLCVHLALCQLICVDWLIFECGLKLKCCVWSHIRARNTEEAATYFTNVHIFNTGCSNLYLQFRFRNWNRRFNKLQHTQNLIFFILMKKWLASKNWFHFEIHLKFIHLKSWFYICFPENLWIRY